jgi:hypothetical protein
MLKEAKGGGEHGGKRMRGGRGKGWGFERVLQSCVGSRSGGWKTQGKGNARFVGCEQGGEKERGAE